MTDSETPSAPTVQKKATNPPGILPRNAQVWFIGGISILMVLVIAFSGSKEPKARDTAKAQSPQAQDPNQQRIEDYRARIDEQARKLAAEQAQLAQTKQVLGIPSNAMAGPPNSRYAVAAQTPLAYERPSAPEKSWIETDREKREYQSLFASNVALSYRPETKVGEQETKPVAAASLPNNSPSYSETSTELAQPEPVPSGNPSASDTRAADRRGVDVRAKERDAEIDRAQGKKYRLLEGTVIETVLTNRLDGSFSGPVNCMVTTNVYSHDRQRLLIPQGTRVLGEVKRVDSLGQQRLAVAFHRLIMPDGYSVTLDQFQGLNQIGETGLLDQMNHHYLQVFGVSLAIGAIAGLSQVNTASGIDASAEDAYRQGVASSLSQSSLRILDKYLNVLPTFTIREGHRVKVYLAGDLLLPAYENHRIPGDL